MDWTIHFEHLWTTAGISLYNPGPSSASITMMRHVAICSLPEPFAHPSLPHHPRMSDPPANISVELTAIVDSTQPAFQAKKHVFLLEVALSNFLSLSVHSPSWPFREPPRLRQRGHLPSHLNSRSPAQKDSKIQRMHALGQKTVYCAPAPPPVEIVQLPNLDVLNQPQRLPEILRKMITSMCINDVTVSQYSSHLRNRPQGVAKIDTACCR